MAGHRSLVRSIILILGSSLLVGCANFPTLWQTNAPPAPEPAPPPALLPEKQSNASKPQPAPGLFIPDAPPSQALAPRVAEPAPIAQPIQLPDAPVTPVAMAQEVPARAQPPLPVAPAKEAPNSAVADMPAQPLQGPASLAAMRELAQRTAKRYAGMDCYIMRLRRREMSHGKLSPDEIMLCKFRREPCSVYMKWLGEVARNREVVYVKGKYKNVIHTLTAAGDIPLIPAGYHFKVSPDSALYKAHSRYPITDAGLGPVIGRFTRMVELAEKGDASEGTATYMGKSKRPEYPNDLIVVHQALAPRADPHLPRGGQRWWFFDPTNDLPVLLITHDEAGRETEYYCHDRFILNLQLTDDDFNPEKLWPQSR